MKRLFLALVLATALHAVDRPAAAVRMPADLKIVDHIVFKKVGDVSLELMLFQPLEKKFEKTPLVVYIHGGGFGGGDRTKVLRPDSIGVVRELNRRGFTCASVEYRLTDGHATVNESVADCKDAVRFLAKHADEYGIDPSRIGTFGSSAGGTITLVTALGDDRDYPCDPALDGAPAKIRCVAAFYGLASFIDPELAKGSNFEKPGRFVPILGGPLEERRDLAKKLSAIELLRADSPAIFLAHGDADVVINFKNSIAMRDAAQAKGVPVECVISHGAGHGFGGEKIDPTIEEIDRRTVAFFVKYLNP
jgi:acetyl esterase/lipase